MEIHEKEFDYPYTSLGRAYLSHRSSSFLFLHEHRWIANQIAFANPLTPNTHLLYEQPMAYRGPRNLF